MLTAKTLCWFNDQGRTADITAATILWLIILGNTIKDHTDFYAFFPDTASYNFIHESGLH